MKRLKERVTFLADDSMTQDNRKGEFYSEFEMPFTIKANCFLSSDTLFEAERCVEKLTELDHNSDFEALASDLNELLKSQSWTDQMNWYSLKD